MITAIDLLKLRNAEYIQFIKSCLDITRLNDPAKLNIKPQYDALQTISASLESLFVIEQGSAITATITELDQRRDRAITGFSLAVNAFTYHYDTAIAQAAENLNRQLAQYGSGIARENYQAETAIIDNLLADIDNKAGLAAAITTLNLADWKKELATANQAFNEAYLLRTQELGAASKESLLTKRAEANELYYKLRDFINSYYTINDGAEPYNKACKELNALIEQYNTMMAGRFNNKPGVEIPPAIAN